MKKAGRGRTILSFLVYRNLAKVGVTNRIMDSMGFVQHVSIPQLSYTIYWTLRQNINVFHLQAFTNLNSCVSSTSFY